MRSETDRCDHEQINEIDGYVELGMEREAFALIHATLARKEISCDQFHTCVFALLQTEQPAPWKDEVENAYRHLNKPVSDQVRSAMLNYYWSIGEPKKASLFFPHRSTKFFDAWTMMQVCLELGRLDEAKSVARYCRGVLTTAEDNFTKASMTDALAAYHLHLGEHEAAIRLWQEAPAEPTFQRQRLTGIVKARLLQAQEAAKAGLATVAVERLNADLSIEIQLPGNTTGLMDDAERELKEMQNGIEALIA
ncbi:MAG TPA: hypothetical protein VGM62_05570 [Chthoniobacterales bacterium]|jgi:hypothetical protein